MDAQIRITAGTGEELARSANGWAGEDELRGRVRTVHGPVGDTELGSITELLTVALGGQRRGNRARLVPEDLAGDPPDDREDHRGVRRALGHPGHPDRRRSGTAAGADPQGRAARNSLQAMHALLSDPALCGWPPSAGHIACHRLTGAA
jgi:hypothetical protein